jgi:hypothetical protein
MVWMAACRAPQAAPLTPAEDGQLVLAEAGRPRCTVVVDKTAPEKVGQAAAFLRETLSAMAGCDIPLADVGENPTGTRLVVGSNALAERLGVTVDQGYPGQERYIIRSTGDDIVLLGNDAGGYAGTGMAVSDFLQRLGCGWYSPDPLYHVIPRRETLTAPAMRVDEQPDFLMRQIWMVRDPVLRNAWRTGGYSVNMGHIFHVLIPMTLKEEHPDWFGPAQPCLTHPEVQQHIIKQLRARLDAAPGQFLSLSIDPNDSDGFCQCERCQAVGNVSARMMVFANNIADALRETHPGQFELGFLAFWVRHEPPSPMVEGRPELSIIIVNEGDHTKPLDEPVSPENAKRGRSNLREQQALEGWHQTGQLEGVYEWWIPGCNNVDWRSVPWYSGEAALRNLRYWHERGLRYLSYETQYEHGNGFPIRWPLYYMAARGAWDTTLHADDIMREACAKLFGEASEHMFWFYRTLEMAMLHTPHAGGNWHLPSPELIYTSDIEARATAYIAGAAELTEDPEALARIAGEQRMWNQARATLAKLRAQSEKGAFAVHYGERTMHWSEPIIGAQALCDIFGIAGDVPIQAVEGDGNTRDVRPGESFDLRTGIKFRERGPG